MASKEVSIFILDVGRSMGSTGKRKSTTVEIGKKRSRSRSESPENKSTRRKLPENQKEQSSPSTEQTKLQYALKAVSMMVQAKMIQGRKTDNIGLVLVGTDETSNELAVEDQYQHITVAKEIGPPDLELVKYIEEELIGGSKSGDCLDGVIVSVDLMIRFVQHYKYEKRIYLITDAESSINKNDVDFIVSKLNESEISFDIIGLDFDDPDTGYISTSKSKIKRENEAFLKELVEKLDGAVFPIHEALKLLTHFRIRSYRQTTTFRGLLSIAGLSPETDPDALYIPVHCYTRTMETKLPSAKKCSNISLNNKEEDQDKKSMEVQRLLLYQTKDEEEKELTDKDLVKAYRYGKMLVPFGAEDEEAIKLKESRSMLLVGFVKTKHIPREIFMGNVQILVPPPNEPVAAKALSALTRALFERDQVALVRVVAAANRNPKLYALFPRIKANYEALVMIHLPFAEDVRSYFFGTLKSHEQNLSAHQLNVMDNLIDSMDLMTAGLDDDGKPVEALQPKHTFNPAYQRLYQCIQFRALHPDVDTLPEIDPIILEQMRPIQSMMDKLSSVSEQMKEAFVLEKVEAKGKGKKEARAWGQTTLEEGPSHLDKVLAGGAELTLKGLMDGPIEHVGVLNPVSDFKALIDRRDVDKVPQAINEMINIIIKLAEESFGRQLFEKAFTCLRALRESSIKEDEPELFNQGMRTIKTKFENTDFWNDIVAEKITLIDKTENSESSVDKAGAQEFLRESAIVKPLQDSGVADVDDDQDLLDMMD